MTKKVAIIGAAGLTGQELLRLLSPRTDVEIIVANSNTFAGQKISKVFPELDTEDLVFSNYSAEQILELKPDAVFLAVANGESMKWTKELTNPPSPLSQGGIPKIIDLSADFRFKDLNEHFDIYQIKHCMPEVKAAYGLPELFSEDIKKAQIVANPGCYATASLLLAAPLNHKNLVKHAIFDGKTGVSGAGARPSQVNNFNNLAENIIPYKLANHRHQAEIQQFTDYPISFTPHVVPLRRGMIVTGHFLLDKKIDIAEIIKLYQDFYRNFPETIVQSEPPTLRPVQMNNKAILGGFAIDKHNRLVIIAAIDNLSKGASAQAVQNFDLMFS